MQRFPVIHRFHAKTNRASSLVVAVKYAIEPERLPDFLEQGAAVAGQVEVLALRGRLQLDRRLRLASFGQLLWGWRLQSSNRLLPGRLGRLRRKLRRQRTSRRDRLQRGAASDSLAAQP